MNTILGVFPQTKKIQTFTNGLPNQAKRKKTCVSAISLDVYRKQLYWLKLLQMLQNYSVEIDETSYLQNTSKSNEIYHKNKIQMNNKTVLSRVRQLERMRMQ